MRTLALVIKLVAPSMFVVIVVLLIGRLLVARKLGGANVGGSSVFATIDGAL
jgi:hypothetical protein